MEIIKLIWLVELNYGRNCKRSFNLSGILIGLKITLNSILLGVK